MSYEICRAIFQDGVCIWTMIALTDLRSSAVEIMFALHNMNGDKYGVLCDGKVIRETS